MRLPTLVLISALAAIADPANASPVPEAGNFGVVDLVDRGNITNIDPVVVSGGGGGGSGPPVVNLPPVGVPPPPPPPVDLPPVVVTPPPPPALPPAPPPEEPKPKPKPNKYKKPLKLKCTGSIRIQMGCAIGGWLFDTFLDKVWQWITEQPEEEQDKIMQEQSDSENDEGNGRRPEPGRPGEQIPRAIDALD